MKSGRLKIYFIFTPDDLPLEIYEDENTDKDAKPPQIKAKIFNDTKSIWDDVFISKEAIEDMKSWNKNQ